MFARQQTKFDKLEQAKRDFLSKISDEQLKTAAIEIIIGDSLDKLEEEGLTKYKADSHLMYYDFVKANEDPSMMQEYIV